ncbi:hypothetical protein BO83DRAFT_383630 [Aspergillus eucalypticola CBS 122712]|uniref:Extracellular membrane protein CFEM domain-containing protein n=1 Tax=Aspergillus eucalypticola (strain CBS 122712 / IBT 29274) TaxID=1448314 RepID=A0A317ULH3_ASPEC|nr:uncharacterized protein BO83DRAFT_383630 [Aspergillus eucalypticola CBS 122712]PWY61986.1 hypothetical protein BO83DRAFT_383630 [Aspergillus eucalypticola CBS 122712]
MRVQTVIASVFLGVGIATAAETCDNSYSEKDCNWEGTALFCGAIWLSSSQARLAWNVMKSMDPAV